jgi:hypothetical protein
MAPSSFLLLAYVCIPKHTEGTSLRDREKGSQRCGVTLPRKRHDNEILITDFVGI